MPHPILAIDFGTSNTAVAVHEGEGLRRVKIEGENDTLPTAVFFPPRAGSAMLLGEAAARALIEGQEGRYMRALKSVLGTPLFTETRLIGGKRRAIQDIITEFLRELRARTTQTLGYCPARVLSGRPVFFHPDSPERDAKAEADLRACYLAAGFEDVAFMAEPEAAAWACHSVLSEAPGLVIDIGGGTSDFSIFKRDPAGITILASHGIRLGGQDFDRLISMSHVMARLGHGGDLRREMGEGLLPVPNGIFADLADWAKIPFLYTPETRRDVAAWLKVALDPKRLSRLQSVLEEELGHELAFATEAGKIAVNMGEVKSRIDMSFIESGLSAPISQGSVNLALASQRSAIAEAIETVLQQSNLTADQIGHVILVGGSSLMSLVPSLAEELLPKAQISRFAAFTAIVDGLAIAAAQRQ